VDGGKCNLIGHSLGSVICWDLLSILKDVGHDGSIAIIPEKQPFGVVGSSKESSAGVAITTKENPVDVGYQAYAAQEDAAATPQNGTWGPTLPAQLKETLPFVPENVIFLGSPIGMFLTLRGAHAVFDQLRQQLADSILEGYPKPPPAEEADVTNNRNKGKNTDANKAVLPYASPFTLPVNRGGGIYNIFHPSDPVAYRIEPLLLPPETNVEDLPIPIHLTAPGQDVRFHVKAQQLGDEIVKAMEGRRGLADFGGSISMLITNAVSALGKHGEIEVSPRSATEALSIGPKVFPLGGKSDRVDFQLQRGVVDNEYISAVTAHSTYFVSTDVQDFIIGLADNSKEDDKE
jgi:DDHD domain